MAAQNTVQRAGKSLLKFFRPIRTGTIGSQSGARSPQSRHAFRLARRKKDENKKDQKHVQTAAPSELDLDTVEFVPAPKDGNDWLGVVVHLLSVCKQVSKKMGRKKGSAAYKAVQDSSMRQKMKIVGSIINVTNAAEFDLPEEKQEQTAKADTRTVEERYPSQTGRIVKKSA